MKKSNNPTFQPSSIPIIGVLALQGAVQLHKPHIEAAGAEFRAVKTAEDFKAVDGFILPGGESTTMLKLIEVFNLWDALADEFSRKPVWGICAGTILIAEKSYRTDNLAARDTPHLNPLPLEGGRDGRGAKQQTQKSFGLLPIAVCRNGYGPQVDSHMTQIENYTVSFIRAPVITDSGDCVVRAVHQGDPVWVQKGQYMASTFHPELTLDFPSPMHRMFVDLVTQNA